MSVTVSWSGLGILKSDCVRSDVCYSKYRKMKSINLTSLLNVASLWLMSVLSLLAALAICVKFLNLGGVLKFAEKFTAC